MSLVEGGGQGEIDIIGKLMYLPDSKTDWIYRTWEAKVSLLHKDGTAKSLKAGKTPATVTQMKNYRRFGAMSVTLLDLYICEAGALAACSFPPEPIKSAIRQKEVQLTQEGFGYQIIPFEHSTVKDRDFGIKTLRIPDATTLFPPTGEFLSPAKPPVITSNTILPQPGAAPTGSFALLVEKLDSFFESCGERPSKHRQTIIFCEGCKQLQLLNLKDQAICPSCGQALVEEPELDHNVRMPQFRLDAQKRPYIEGPNGEIAYIGRYPVGRLTLSSDPPDPLLELPPLFEG